jgi:hypothetical protein
VRSERGIAVPVALIVLLITLTLGGAAVLASTQVNDLSNRDTGSKAALEAADAGIKTAIYRLNMLGSQDAYCPTTPAVAWDATSRLCVRDGPVQDDARWNDAAPDDSASHLGNAATFSYWVSGPLRTGDSCAGDVVQNAQFPVAQRCVTSIGTSGRVSSRAQARVAAYAAQPLFGGAGLIGVHSLSIAQNSVIKSTIGSLGAITLNNNVFVDGTTESNVAVELGPSATLTKSNGVVLLPANQQTAGVDGAQLNIAPVDPGCSSLGVGAAPAGDPCAGKGWNSDDRLAGCPHAASATKDACDSGVSFNSSTRSLTLGNNSNVTLAGSTLPYNFCNLSAVNNANIYIAAGARVVIFIDSSDQDGGNKNGHCPAGSGNLTVKNNLITNNNDDPTSLQIYVYGTSPKGSNNVTWWNNGTANLTLYAPNSSVDFKNNGVFKGGLGAYDLILGNNTTFIWDGREGDLSARPQGLYYRSAWRQCPAQPTTSDPRSGC